ncbi:MAG: hypothetical protein ABIS29_12380, partial [Vicinamibacterales bacterium]
KLDELQASALTGTEGAASPFFSPNGQWIAFFGGDKLKKVSVVGGAVIALCDAPRGRGGTWADDDAIIFTPNGGVGPNSLLMRISAAGGKPAPFGTPLEDGKTQRWPQTIPGGNAILYTEHSAGGAFDGANIVVAPLVGGTPKIVVRGGYFGRYVASGHLLYMEQGTLMAMGFDPKRLTTIGQAVPVLEGLSGNGGSMGSAQLSVSLEGTLVYVPGSVAGQAAQIEWTTRDGKTSMLRATPANWTEPRFSPDGQKLAFVIFDSRQDDIWVYDWARDTLAQLTFDLANDSIPIWTPDGRRIVFASDRAKAGISNLYWVNADGTGEVTRLTDSPNPQTPDSWHPSGRFLAFHELRAASSQDLMLLSMEVDAARGWTPGKSSVFLSTAATESNPMFSPDGRWIAYGSNEAGNPDVYVRPFPGPGGKWRVSTEGASLPHWSAAAHELLFVSQGRVMATSYSVVGDAFRADKPQVWSPTRIVPRGNSYMYDIHPDGMRLALSRSTAQNVVEDKVVFVFNFADYLRKIVPTTK